MDGDDTTRSPAPHDDGRSDADLLAAAHRGTEHLAATSPEHVAGLWDGIAAAAFGDDAGPARPVVRAVAGDGRPRAGATRARRRSMVRDVEAGRRRSTARALTGVAAMLAVVIATSWVVTRAPATPPVATFRMDPLDDRAPATVSGTIVAADGGQSVAVDLASLPAPPDDTFYELWLLDLDEGRLVSLGPVGGDPTFTVPDAVADGSWPTIDVSVEPADGDPTHSGDSVLRGPVTAASTG